MKVTNYRELIAWQKAIELVTHVYDETKALPREEIYGLTSQMRRAAVSIPSNIAEGQGRHSTGEFRQFLGNAQGSLYELETQIIIARKLGYLSADSEKSLLTLAAEVGRILNGLDRSLAANA